MKNLAASLAAVSIIFTSARAAAIEPADGPIAVRVVSKIEGENNNRVHDVVAEHVVEALSSRDFLIDETSSRILDIHVGRSRTNSASYEIQIAAVDKAGSSKHFSTFECACAGTELLDEIEDRLVPLLPRMWESGESEPAPPPRAHVAHPEPASAKQQTRSHNEETPLFIAGLLFTTVGGSLAIGTTIGFPVAANDRHGRIPPVAYVIPAAAGTLIVSGATMLAVNNNRKKRAHPTSIWPLRGRF